MSRIDTNFVKQLYSQAGVELTPEKLDHISNNYSSNEELQSAFELKYGSMNASTPEKKNSDVTSVSTSEVPQSESQQPQKKASSLSVGGKPIRTGDLESSVGDDKVIYINKDPKRGKVDDMSTPPPAGYRYQVVQNSVQLKKWKEQKSKINNESPFGPPIQTFQEQKSQEFKEVKKKEESKKKEALKSMPILGKDVKLNVPKADTKTTDLSGVKKVDIKPLTKTEQVSKNQVVNVAYDYAVNNLDTSLSEEKYQDEINEKQFTDGIKQGLINIYNDVIGNPLSSVTNLDLVVKKSKPLESQYKEIEKIEAKEGVSYSPEVKEKMAKDMFIEEENKKQMYTLIDKALPSGYDREGIWKDLKLQSIRSNDELRSVIASAEVFKGKINQFDDFVNSIPENQEGNDGDYIFEINGKKKVITKDQYQEYEKLKQEAIDAQSKLKNMSSDIDKIYKKASKDDELLDLFKYNYNDFQATKDQLLGGFETIVGGTLKILGEGSKYIESKIGFAPGLALIPGVSDESIEIGNALLDDSEERTSPYLRYNASDLTWDNLGSFSRQLLSEQLPIMLSIGLGGTAGLVGVSASSGGRQFRDLEMEEKNNPFVKYSQGQKLMSSLLYGGAELGGEAFGTKVLLKGFGNTIRNASLQNRRLFYDGMIKSTIKSLPKVATGAGVEGGSELATATMQIGVDLGVLGKEVKSKEAFERLYEATAAGVGMGVGMSVVANNIQLVAAQSKVFSTRQDMRKVGNLLNEIDVLNQELNNNPLLSEEDKAIIYKDMNAKTNEAFNIVSKNSAREKDFTIQEKAELLNINARQIELKEDYDKITDSNISEKIKKQKIDELNNKFNALESKRNDILNKTYNEFNYLPESEKISLKIKAAEAIIQEELDKGVERDKIQEPNAEVINKKAIEIYESNKQTTGQVSEQEKPAIATEAETTDTTQAGTETKPQEKINSVESDLNNNNLSKIEISLSRQGFVGDFLNDYEFLAEGSEHIVYRSKDGKTVIKIGEPYGSNEGFMPRVKDAILINSLIGDGSLEVIGYYEQNGVKNPIYKQNYLKGEIASQAEVSSYLESKGFLNIGNDNFVANVDGKFLRISDTSDNFIKDKDGNIFAIDAGIVEISENDLTDTQKQEINKITNKTETDAVQEQITDEGVLQPEQSEMGLQEMEQGDQVNQEPTEQGKEKVKLQQEVQRASDRLSKAFDAYKNIGIVFDPEGNWKKDKELVSSLVEFAVSNIKFGTYNVKNLIEDLAKKGIDITTENAKFIMNKANRAFKRGIEKSVGVKPKSTEQKRINKAFSIGVAEQKVQTEAQKQKTKLVKEELSDLNKQFKDVVSALNKVRDVEQKEKLEKQKAKIQEKIDQIKGLRVELSDLKTQLKDVFNSAKEALKIEKDRNKVIDGLKKDVNKFVKSSIEDLDAGDIGKRAISSIISKVQDITDQNFEEKLLEVNDILDNLYTNRDVNKAKSDSKNAYSNVMSGKVGKLDKEGDTDKVMSSKVVGLTMLDPNILKKVLSDVDFSQYKDYINRLAERSLAIKETDLKAINDLYDRIISPYTDHVSEVNRIQQIIDSGGTLSSAESKFVEDNKSEFSERETPESIAEKESKKADRDAKKQADIAKKKRKIKELLPFISDVFASSIAEKGSIEWDILENLSNLTDEDIESMPENMLNNVFNALNSMVYNDVLVSYANEIHKYKLKQDHKKTFMETLSKAGKKGIYKAKLIKPLLKLREVVGLPISAIWNGIKNDNLKQEIIDRRLKFFNFSSIDAALKVYGETPIFDNIMSRFGKAVSRIYSIEDRVETILLKAKKDLDKRSKNPQESYLKVVYHLIDAMAKNNIGTKSAVSAMKYFEATLSDPNSKIAENNRAKELIQAFVNKVKANNNEIEELTKEELNAVNAIRRVLDDNKINAYEANFFQNSNASPMINAYYPVMNSIKNQAEQDLAKLKNRFGVSNIVSIKSGNLEEKTGTAHPIDMNPFSTAFSSIKNTIFQHQLRAEYQALKQALSELEIENANNEEVLSYLSGIKKAVDSQFELLMNEVVHISPSFADNILNAMDKSFYTLALGSVVSRGVDFLGNMVQLAAISPKILANNRRVLNNLLAIKKDDESGTEILRNFYKNAEASEINKMISSKKISTERTEFINRGVNRDVLSKGLPSSNVGTKIKARIIDPITSVTSGAVDLLLGFGDIKPYGISWNGVFYEEFKKQAGVEVDVEKIARGDVEYLKRYKDAIKKSSNKANQENADLYGSTNPMEKKVGIMEIAKKPVKSSLAGAIGALRNKAAYLFSSFDMNARNAINTSINTYIENQDSREARKLIGGAVRLAMYSASISYTTSALWNAFKGDDDDEDELKKSFDKLSDNDDFIKYVNSSLLDFPIQKDAEGNIIQLNIDDLARYNEMRDKLMSNKEFAKAYDIMYGYLNRDLFDIQVRSKVNQINQGNYEYDRSVVDGFFTDIDNGFGKSGEDIIEVLGILNSEQGYKMFTQEEIDGNILKVEEYMSKIDFLNNRAIRESGGAIDRLLITKVASTLSDYRTNASLEDTSVTEGLKILMGMMFSRSNNFGKAAANYSAEFANKLITESKRGERGYDVYKDGIFQSPVKYKLKEDASLIDDAVNVLFPVFQKFDKYRYSDYSLPDLIRFTPMGILGVNDLAKINSKMKNDVIYQETNGKYKENILKDISKTKIDILRDKKKVEQDRLDEQFKKSRVIPGVKETKLKSRFPSYNENKDLKVNGRSAN